LARSSVEVVGVDIDAEMLGTARRKAPGVDWQLADLSTVDLGRPFDAIVMAGNVMIFLEPGTEGAVIANMARHLAPGGQLIAGFQLQPGRLTLKHYDEMAAAEDLILAERWATWDCLPWDTRGEYAVSVHRRH
jgi:SAM-dependent methyltransferase